MAFVVCSLVADVTLASAQPVTIQDVSPATDQVGSAAQAVDSRGNTMFMWSVGSGSGPSQAYRTVRYDASSGTYGAPADLAASPGDRLRFVMDEAGDATAFGNRGEIVVARYSAATGRWGTMTTLMSPVVAGPWQPVGVADVAGNVTVVWLEAACYASNGNLHAARYSVGRGWTVRSIANNVWFRFEPTVAVDASGNVLVISARERNGTTAPTLLAMRYGSSSGTWSGSDGPQIDDSRVENSLSFPG